MRAGALPEPTPAHADRAAKVARLELVRPGIRTAATLAHERTLPVIAGLHDVVPSGALQRGSTLAAHGPGATSFALALGAEATRSGSYLAIVARSTFNLGACLDFGIPLRRVVQFVLPDGADGRARWLQLVAAVIEGFDVVVVADRRRATGSQARQLATRTRERGSVLVRAGGPSWPDAPDLRFDLHEPSWHGLGAGHGHLNARTIAVQVAGRRWPGAPRIRHLRLSGDGVEPVEGPRALTPLVGPSTRVPAPAAASSGTDAEGRFAGADIDELVELADRSDTGSPEHGRARFGTVA